MSTRLQIYNAIQLVAQEAKFKKNDILDRMNRAVSLIAAGIRMPDGMIRNPDGRISPALPDLYSSDTVATDTAAAFASLPDEYQRNVIYISDSNREWVRPPLGGDYYSFNMFLRRIRYKDMSETGTIYITAIRGSNLYYQGIPSTSKDLLVNFYRKPVDMATDNDTPDGIPDAYQMDLVKNHVLMDVFSDMIGNDLKADVKYPDKAFSKNRIAEKKFYETLENMIQFVGETEGQPAYYHSGNEYEESDW